MASNGIRPKKANVLALSLFNKSHSRNIPIWIESDSIFLGQ
jgi:hypothetical protein